MDGTHDFPQIATPGVAPSAGRGKLFLGLDGRFYNLQTSGVALPVGDGGPNGALAKWGNAALGNGVQSLAIAFGAVFSAAPSSIQVTLGVPHGGALITIAVDLSTITAAGFTVVLAAPTPNNEYTIHWNAKI